MSFWRFWMPQGFLELLRAVLDITIIAFVIYRLLLLIRGTRAVQLVKGLAVLVVLAFLSDLFHLAALNWLLDQVGLLVVVALPVVFQPELRRALEQLGRGRFFARPITFLGLEDTSRLINELVRAVQVLVKNRAGALLVIERETGLNDFMETGVQVDGVVSAELVVNIFMPHTPLHDGACLIRGDRVLAAGCFLPLTDSPYLSKQLGTRHRAALGISEISDALAVVVSEETGAVSVAQEGRLTRYLDEKNLKEILGNALLPKQPQPTSFWHWGS